MAAEGVDGVRTILVDGESGAEYTLILNVEDAKRVKVDMVYATTLLHQAQRVQQAASMRKIEKTIGTNDSQQRACPMVIEESEDISEDIDIYQPKSCSPLVEQDDEIDDTLPQQMSSINERNVRIDNKIADCQPQNRASMLQQDEGLCNWTPPMCLLLLASYKANILNFTSGKMSQKQAWDIISQKMAVENYNVSGAKCNSKFTSMKRTYKNVKDHNKKSGNDRKTWIYLEKMDEMFAKKPWIEPVETASSSGVTSELDFNSNGTTESNSKTKRQKSNTADYLKELVEERKKLRQDKEQQHDAKMEEIRKMNIFLEKLLQQSK